MVSAWSFCRGNFSEQTNNSFLLHGLLDNVKKCFFYSRTSPLASNCPKTAPPSPLATWPANRSNSTMKSVRRAQSFRIQQMTTKMSRKRSHLVPKVLNLPRKRFRAPGDAVLAPLTFFFLLVVRTLSLRSLDSSRLQDLVYYGKLSWSTPRLLS